MMNLDYIYDVIDAAKSDKAFDKVNSIEIGAIHGVDPVHVAEDIITRRHSIEEVRKAKESLKVLQGELDKLG